MVPTWLLTVLAPAGLVALMTFLLSQTRTTRLRNDEAVLRDGMSRTDAASQQAQVLAALHKVVMAQLVSRQLTSRWQLSWPVLAWAGVIAVFAETGVTVARLVLTPPSMSPWNVLVQVTGDPTGGVLGLVVVLAFYPLPFRELVRTLTMRAQMARHYYDGKPVHRWETSLHRRAQTSIHEDMQRRHRLQADAPTPAASRLRARDSVVAYVCTLAPTCLATGIGLTTGLQLVILDHSQAERLQVVDRLSGYLALLTVLMTISGMVTLSAVSHARARLRELELPRTYPWV